MRAVLIFPERLPPLHRAERAAQLGVALEAEDGLHALQAVGLDAGADGLPGDAVEVDENLAAQGSSSSYSRVA